MEYLPIINLYIRIPTTHTTKLFQVFSLECVASCECTHDYTKLEISPATLLTDMVLLPQYKVYCELYILTMRFQNESSASPLDFYTE